MSDNHISTATATAQNTLGISYGAYTINNSLQDAILSVVDAIIEQDSTDRGAWDYVVTRRISLDYSYSEHEVRREIERMLKSGRLYENCLEIRDGILFMRYVRNGSEILD